MERLFTWLAILEPFVVWIINQLPDKYIYVLLICFICNGFLIEFCVNYQLQQHKSIVL